jgi:hypothetical protein
METTASGLVDPGAMVAVSDPAHLSARKSV